MGGALYTFHGIVPTNRTYIYTDFSMGNVGLFESGLGFRLKETMGGFTTCAAAAKDIATQPLVPVDVAFFVTAEAEANSKMAEVRCSGSGKRWAVRKQDRDALECVGSSHHLPACVWLDGARGLLRLRCPALQFFIKHLKPKVVVYVVHEPARMTHHKWFAYLHNLHPVTMFVALSPHVGQRCKNVTRGAMPFGWWLDVLPFVPRRPLLPDDKLGPPCDRPLRRGRTVPPVCLTGFVIQVGCGVVLLIGD